MHSQFRIAVATCSLPCVHTHLPNLTTTHARLASTHASSSKSSPFPFPSHRNPTPHQIFHLPPGASQADIKARCKSITYTTHQLTLYPRQTTSSPGHSTPTRQQHKHSPQLCVTRASTPSPEHTTSSAANHTPYLLQMRTLMQSSRGADDSDRYTASERQRTLRRRQAWAGLMRLGRTR